jgi:hypothetical protein
MDAQFDHQNSPGRRPEKTVTQIAEKSPARGAKTQYHGNGQAANRPSMSHKNIL